ncbi:MAG: hypothetical protein A3D41_03565 [Candidatus Sungbacteria bacterium RIFCSPHIGHO2_02_FULL_41_12b]|nr:MAG: hypothetical protein A3D41_03565 [Candidatus Sungbacteria bacterium RIFCSPHIGHO2_02_FULL_41_12b]
MVNQTALSKRQNGEIGMDDRNTTIKNWLLQETGVLITVGQYSGSQSVLPEWFLPSNQHLYIKPNILPVPTIEEITQALNGLAMEKKLFLDKLQSIEGKIRIRMRIP